MRLTIIGSSGSVSGPESASSCYLVEADADGRTWRLVLDLGSGAFGQLLRYGDPAAIDGVLISHLHADHVVDMAALHVYLKYGPGAPHPRVDVYGPEHTQARLAQICGDSDTADDQFRVLAWDPAAPVRIGPFTIEPVAVRHPTPAFAIRVTGPSESGDGARVITYTGDTDACAGVAEAADGAHLLLSEAAFEEGRDTVRGIHLTGRRAGELASGAGVRRLVLTHIPPWTSAATVLAEALTAYSGPVDLAEPGATWAL
ncbi:MBL fold metallo-hydrolase [Occultella glacieicola]|uniref:MBL fold metallo-hydrolase n=1 Tax=Occultella glacieicola TaxID=2518684 RepID=A0ABY2EC19_9MICO|nr:MBL fold metallo-hydrolase [Occultella glacieicola]TDE97374.1 MBL fold metallo-hydrolase [Occultella glacieicola]